MRLFNKNQKRCGLETLKYEVWRRPIVNTTSGETLGSNESDLKEVQMKIQKKRYTKIAFPILII